MEPITVKGSVIAYNEHLRPTKRKIEKWVTLMKMFIDNYEIDVNMYGCGKAMTNPELTWDVDIILSHPNAHAYSESDLFKIRDLMNFGMQVGYDQFQLLIDISFYLPFNEKGDFWYSADRYIKHGTMSFKQYSSYATVVYKGQELTNYHTNDGLEIKEIVDGLFEIVSECPTTKDIDRIEKGILYPDPVLL